MAVGGRDVAGDGRSARIGVFDDGHCGRVAQLVDDPPGRVGVVDVEEAELLSAVLRGGVPPAVLPFETVTGPLLMGILAIAERLRVLERKVQRRRKRRARCACGDGIEPRDDRRVVGSGVRERITGELPPGRLGECTVRGAQLRQHRFVCGRINQNPYVRIVLCGGAHHRRATDVDQLDRRVGTERIEVAHDEIDRGDVVRRDGVEVFDNRPVGQDAGVQTRVQGLDPAVEHLGESCDVLHREVRYAGRGKRLGRPAARDQLEAELDEARRKCLDSRLVVDGQERAMA